MEGGIGVAIPRALFPHSTSRNRLRRQIREAVRILSKERKTTLQRQMIQQDLLIRVRKGGHPSFKMIQDEMKGHLEQLKSLQ